MIVDCAVHYPVLIMAELAFYPQRTTALAYSDRSQFNNL